MSDSTNYYDLIRFLRREYRLTLGAGKMAADSILQNRQASSAGDDLVSALSIDRASLSRFIGKEAATVPTVSARRLAVALKSLDADVWAAHRDGLCESVDKDTLIDAMLCDMQRAREILSGGVFFDYDRQEWIEKEVAK